MYTTDVDNSSPEDDEIPVDAEDYEIDAYDTSHYGSKSYITAHRILQSMH